MPVAECLYDIAVNGGSGDKFDAGTRGIVGAGLGPNGSKARLPGERERTSILKRKRHRKWTW